MYTRTCLSVTTTEQQYIGWQCISIAVHTLTTSCLSIFFFRSDLFIHHIIYSSLGATDKTPINNKENEQ